MSVRTIRVDRAVISADPRPSGQYVRCQLLNPHQYDSGREMAWVCAPKEGVTPMVVSQVMIHPGDRQRERQR